MCNVQTDVTLILIPTMTAMYNQTCPATFLPLGQLPILLTQHVHETHLDLRMLIQYEVSP